MSADLPHAAGAKFEAKFDGRCPDCGDAVYTGDYMQYIDDVAVCAGCGDAAVEANHQAVRENRRRWQEEERAKDPDAYDKQQAAVKAFVDSVHASALRHPGKDWIPSPDGKGFVNITHPLYETKQEEAPVAVEPGIQALMAAGLLSGQEPGGSGVCDVTITDAAGKVTEVAVPVPTVVSEAAISEQPAPKARAPRKSRAKPKPEPVTAEVPSTNSVEDAAAAALARVREGAAAVESVIMATAGPDLPSVASRRLEELARNAKGWDPATIAAEVNPPAPAAGVSGTEFGTGPDMANRTAQDTALQASLQAAVDAGLMSAHDAAAIGWVAPVGTIMEVAGVQFTKHAGVIDMTRPGGTYVAPARTAVAIQDFKANIANPAADIFIDALAAAASLPEEDAILASLDNLAPYVGMPGGVEEAKKSILGVIEDAITNHPRSLQKTIGPSEIGTECDHCLAAKLAGWDQIREGGAWLPTVGTAVHSWLEEAAFSRVALDDSGRPRYLMERRVSVGEINGQEITGSTDLVDLRRGMTWDWKIVGATTLKSAKVSPSQRYIIQQMLYARGWRRLGVLITHVGIAYLPRNDVSLRKAVLWTAEYDESIAVAALDRANRMALNLQAMESISAEVRDNYITGLPRWRSWRENVGGIEKLVYGNAQEGQIECLDCARLADYPLDAATAEKQLAGLMA